MKISAYSAVGSALLTGALLVTSCANDVETVINDDPTGDAISFSPAVGHSTRATETTITNLGNFAVVARGMHHDGVLYDNFLIGSGTAGEVATRDGSSNTWKLNHNVYWPSTFDQVMFFAYTTLKSGDTGSPLYDDSSFGFDSKDPFINGYAPKNADLTVSSDDEAAVWADGKEQKDLVVAYTMQERKTSPTTVSLNFKHALTQISITAKQKDKIGTDHRIVKIKGAWIVNVAESGKLSGSLKYNHPTQTTDDKLSWTGTGKVAYGSFYNHILELNKDDNMDLLRPEGIDKDSKPILGSMMLVPEDLTGWDKTQGNKGAYILLLCRVELKHSGDTHEGEVNMGDIYAADGYHYHQLFPVNTTEYNAAEYGFVCVPLSSTWNTEGIGKHYTYNLDICGETTGAGLYPPVTSDDIKKLIPEGSKVGGKDLIVVTALPDKKNVGDPVLDEPIKFSVTVEDWVTPAANDWTPGNGKF